MTEVRRGGGSLLIWVGASVIAIAVLGLMYPYGFPLLSLAVGGYLLAVLGTGRGLEVPVIVPFYLLLFLLLIALALTPGSYARPVSDAINGVGVAVLLVLLNTSVRGPADLLKLQYATAALIWVTGVIVGLVGLWKMHLLVQGVILERFIAPDGTYRVGTSLRKDYNFYALGQILTLVTAWYVARRSNTRIIRILALLSLPVMAANVAFSGSRRGILVLVAVVVAWLLVRCIHLIRRLSSARRWGMRPQRAGVLVRSVSVVVILLAAVAVWRIMVASAGLEMARVIALRLSTLQELGAVAGTRTGLWAFGMDELQQYGLRELLLGGGFGYLGRYATHFSPDVAEFTPHNMILAALLSGGVATLATLLWLLGRAGAAYLRNWGLLPLFGVFFLLCSPFALTSLHLLFSFQLLLILTTIPLLPRYAQPR
jgi:hypothetical protein